MGPGLQIRLYKILEFFWAKNNFENAILYLKIYSYINSKLNGIFLEFFDSIEREISHAICDQISQKCHFARGYNLET